MHETAIEPKALGAIFGDDVTLHLPILQKFVAQTDDLLSDFESAYSGHDVEQLRFHAHKFKSSARTVGANHLADLCFALETAAREADWGRIEQLVGQLQPAVEQVRAHVAAI